MATNVVVLVLAAGRGERFGSTKQLALIEGVPMVRHVVDAAMAADVGPVVVVLGHDADRVRAVLPAGAQTVVADHYEEGQAHSLRTGIAAARARGATCVVVLLSDEPTVTRGAILAVATSPLCAPMVRARYDDGPGHPVRLARTLWPAIETLVGDQGARQLPDVDIDEVAVPSARPDDIDHPGDLPGGLPDDR